jgi:hypothetical protein
MTKEGKRRWKNLHNLAAMLLACSLHAGFEDVVIKELRQTLPTCEIVDLLASLSPSAKIPSPNGLVVFEAPQESISALQGLTTITVSYGR